MKGIVRKLIDLTGIWKGISVGLGFVLTLGASALIAVAVTGAMTSFTTGAVLDASQLNTNFSSLKTAIEAIPNWTKNGTSAVFTDGNVGIGTNSPINALHVVGTGVFLDIYNNSLGGPPQFSMRRSRGTEAVPLALQSGDQLGYWSTRGYDGSLFMHTSLIITTATENWNTTSHGSKMDFLTTPNGSTAYTSRMIIDQNGNVGIGSATPAYKLDVAGDINATGCVRGSAGIVSGGGTCSSDERLKRDINYYANSLDKIVQLKPASYGWKKSEYSWLKPLPEKENGLIAQDVEKVFPHLVKTDEKGFKTISYSIEFEMHLIQSIKELKVLHDREKSVSEKAVSRLLSENEKIMKENDLLKKEIFSLKKNVEAYSHLEYRLQSLERMQLSRK